MLEPSCHHSRQSIKRKRRSSNSSESNDENIPWNEEKKRKDCDEEITFGTEENPTIDSECERLPLSELSLFECKNGKDISINELISGQERLSISDCESNPPSILSENDLQSSFQHEVTDEEADSDFDSVVECDYECISDSDKPSTSKQSPELIEDFGQLTPASTNITTPSSEAKKSGQEKRQPLPQLDWANSAELWSMMCLKDGESMTLRNPDLFSLHPSLQPRMRAVLLDWIIEVCEVYKLHRETYYLSMDYLDRYLTSKTDIPKQQLQLIGITCLLIAAKVEEIYPPKISEFAYVTDGACTEQEILKMELCIMKALNWELSPITINNWLSTYLQLSYKDKARHTLGFIFPQFSGDLYKQLSQLLDLSTLDINCLNFSYSVLAASCLYLSVSKRLALRVSGLKEVEVRACVNWMQAFWDVLQEEFPEQRRYKSLPPGPNKGSILNDEHNIMTHTVSLELLEAGQTRFEVLQEESQLDLNLLTPPSSSKKQCKTSSYT